MIAEDHERRVASLLKDIDTLGNQTENVYTDETVRTKLLQTAKRLVTALEKPGDGVLHNAFLVLSCSIKTPDAQTQRLNVFLF